MARTWLETHEHYSNDPSFEGDLKSLTGLLEEAARNAPPDIVQYAEHIERNAASFFAGDLTYGDFMAKQVSLWKEIESHGLTLLVDDCLALRKATHTGVV